MNTLVSTSSSTPRRASFDNSYARLERRGPNGQSRFARHRASSLLAQPRLTDGLWRPLRLDLLPIPVSDYRE